MSDTGETWLLNCEELSTLTISGDPTYGRDFARHLAAQLAVNPWSRRVQVDCIGVAEEAVAMDERISYYPTGAVGSPAAAEVLARSEEHTSELQSLMRTSYAVFCLTKKTNQL